MLVASVVTYNTPDSELKRCLSSLSDKIVCRIYVIDNSRSESTRRVCESDPRIFYIPSDNVGYGAAHNLAMRRSMAERADYHLVLNPDISFNPDRLRTLVDYMDSHPDIGAAQPKIVNPDGTLQYTVRMLPRPADLITRRFLPKFMFKKARNRYELRHIDHSHSFNVPVFQGSFMLLRCSTLTRTGFFDERFFMYPEDIDLTRRIHAVSRTMYLPLMEVVHDHRAASYKNLRMLFIHIVNMIRYFNKWGWIHDAERKKFNHPLQCGDRDRS